MPDPNPTPTPNPPNPPTPAPSLAPTAPSAQEPAKGTSELMSRMGALIGSKPKETPTTPEPPKSDGKITPEPGKPKADDKPKPTVAPADEFDDPKLSAPELRKRSKELKAENARLKAEKQTEIGTLQAKLGAMEKKRYWSDDDEKKYSGLEKELKDAQAELYALNFRRSPQFKENYLDKWQSSYTTAAQRVAGMTVKQVNGDGVENERQATQADFERVRNAPIAEQYQIARQIFGDAAYLVLNEINTLRGIEQSGEEAVAKERKTYDEKKKAFEDQHRQTWDTFEKVRDDTDRELVTKYPQWFGPDESDEASTKALREGEDFVNQAVQSADQMKPEDRAVHAAILRRWASAFPKMVHLVETLKARLDEKDKELGAYKATDPGKAGGGDAGLKPAEPPENTRTLAGRFAGK